MGILGLKPRIAIRLGSAGLIRKGRRHYTLKQPKELASVNEEELRECP